MSTKPIIAVFKNFAMYSQQNGDRSGNITMEMQGIGSLYMDVVIPDELFVVLQKFATDTFMAKQELACLATPTN